MLSDVTLRSMDVRSFYFQSPGESKPRWCPVLIRWAWALHHYFICTWKFIVREFLLRNIKTSTRNHNSVFAVRIFSEIRRFFVLIFSCNPLSSLTHKSIICTPLIFSAANSRYLLANGNTSSKSRLLQAGKSVSFLCSSSSHIA